TAGLLIEIVYEQDVHCRSGDVATGVGAAAAGGSTSKPRASASARARLAYHASSATCTTAASAQPHAAPATPSHAVNGIATTTYAPAVASCAMKLYRLKPTAFRKDA